MKKIIIVGAGASAVHFALCVLRKRYEVLMLDVGYQKPEEINPEDSFNDLKSNLPDPVEYFLGEDYEAVIYPDFDSEYYGFPPSKNYVFRVVPGFQCKTKGFAPLFSFAQGGLAEAWTGGVYPLNDSDLKEFPFCYEELEPYYSDVAKEIGITGVRDDLIRFYPYHRNLMRPLDLDEHSERLLSMYERHKMYLNRKLGFFLGRSRVATLSEDVGRRKCCKYSGRCIWGCPSQSLYTPSITLQRCKEYENFKYMGNIYVRHFRYDKTGRVTSVLGESLETNEVCEFEADKIVLAAGALSSSKIFLDSIYKNTGEVVKLRGLMDNRQILVPFVNLRMIGQKHSPDTYQYHQIAMGIEGGNGDGYVHGQITTLKTAMIHPIIQNIPLDLRTAIFLFRNVHAAIGVLNINLQDKRQDSNCVTLGIQSNSSDSVLKIRYSPRSDEKAAIRKTIKTVKKALLRLGCLVPPGMIHIRPMGASVHYAGTIPMCTTRKRFRVSKYCQSYDFDNLYIVDGAAFPVLPAKNLTFTLMANSARVADNVF